MRLNIEEKVLDSFVKYIFFFHEILKHQSKINKNLYKKARVIHSERYLCTVGTDVFDIINAEEDRQIYFSEMRNDLCLFLLLLKS